MPIILPHAVREHAGSGRDDHHVEKPMTGKPARH
jgi:hypothetical protein